MPGRDPHCSPPARRSACRRPGRNSRSVQSAGRPIVAAVHRPESAPHTRCSAGGVRERRAPPAQGSDAAVLSSLVALSRRLVCPLSTPQESPSWPLLTPPGRAVVCASEQAPRRPQPDRHPEKSFAWLVDTENGGLRETIDDISPIEDYTGNLAVQFGEFVFDDPVAILDECREKDLTYARPLTVTVAFINRETGEIREQSVFMGDFPWMTERGTFIINGTERVVVTQLVRSPGAYLMEPKDREKQVFVAQPDAGPRLLARARDRQEGQGLRPHRPQAQAAGHGAAARDGLRVRRADPRAVRELASTSATRSRPTPRSRAPRRAR